jgi:DNA polymerase-3 subunit beta
MVVECQVKAHVIEAGAFTAPARLLAEIVTQLPEAEVSMTLLGTQLELRTRSSHFLLNTLSADEFPVLPQVEGPPSLVLPQEMFREMVRGVLFAVAPPEETRAVLTGILTQIESGTATLVTTDGRRLARVQKSFDAAAAGTKYRSIIPARAMGELMRLLHDTSENLEITAAQGQVFFRFGSILLVARLLEEGKFPDCESIIPRTFSRTVRVHREQFLSATKRALIMAQEKEAPRLLKLEIEANQLTIRANTPDLGQATEQLPVTIDGEGMIIAFNGRYLQDALTNLVGDEIEMNLNDPLSMGMLRPVGVEGYLYLIMPVRVKEPVPAGV